MNDNLKTDKDFNFITVLDFLNEFKKPIIIITIIAAVAGFVFSLPFFMPPKFQSTVVLFPATTNSISKAVLSEVTSEKIDVLALGQEEEDEQLLQILQSDFITNRIIKKYDLMNHYHISGNYPYTKLAKEFNKNITYRRTEYMSVEISVLDEDKNMAANMANDIAALADTARNNVLHQRAEEVLAIVKQKYDEKQQFINKMVDSLGKIGAIGVPPYSVQGTNTLSEDYIKATISGNAKLANELKQKMELQEKYSPVQKSFLDRIEFENKELSAVRTNYEHALVDANSTLPATMIINHATPAEKKTWPVRWLIITVTTLSALALSIIFFAFYTNVREYRRKKALKNSENTTIANA